MEVKKSKSKRQPTSKEKKEQKTSKSKRKSNIPSTVFKSIKPKTKKNIVETSMDRIPSQIRSRSEASLSK